MKKTFLPISIRLTRQHLNQLMADHISELSVSDNLQIESIDAINLDEICEFQINTSGITKSSFNLSCKPIYNELQKTIEVKEFKIEVTEGNFMVKGVGWLAKKMLSTKIETLVNQKINEGLNGLINRQINKDQMIPLPDAFDLQFIIERFEITTIGIKNNVVDIQIELEGQMGINSRIHK